MTAAATILAQLTVSGCRVELLPDGHRISLDPTPPPHLLALARQHRDDLAALLRDTARAHAPPAAPQARQGVLPVDPPRPVVPPEAAHVPAATVPDFAAMQKPEARAEAPAPSPAISPELERSWLAEQAVETRRERDHEAQEAAAWANASQLANADADADTLCREAIAEEPEPIERGRLRPDSEDVQPALVGSGPVITIPDDIAEPDGRDISDLLEEGLAREFGSVWAFRAGSAPGRVTAATARNAQPAPTAASQPQPPLQDEAAIQARAETPAAPPRSAAMDSTAPQQASPQQASPQQAAPQQADPAAIAAHAAIAVRAAELLEGARVHPAIAVADEAKAAAYFRGRALAAGEAHAVPASSPATIARLRPTSWSDAGDPPQPGDRCHCCGRSKWWTEAVLPRGWRCGQCHPPPVPFGVRWVRT